MSQIENLEMDMDIDKLPLERPKLVRHTNDYFHHLTPPKLVRESYNHLPWNHKSFESWKEYVSKNARSDGLVYPSIHDSYPTLKGFGLDDWKPDYGVDDIVFPHIEIGKKEADRIIIYDDSDKK
jgi:hypothetical protein